MITFLQNTTTLCEVFFSPTRLSVDLHPAGRHLPEADAQRRQDASTSLGAVGVRRVRAGCRRDGDYHWYSIEALIKMRTLRCMMFRFCIVNCALALQCGGTDGQA